VGTASWWGQMIFFVVPASCYLLVANPVLLWVTDSGLGERTDEEDQSRVCSLREKYVKSYCSIFRCYLAKFVQSWINWAQKIRPDIYRQTMQLVIFFTYI
jgi:hypothetical protein